MDHWKLLWWWIVFLVSTELCTCFSNDVVLLRGVERPLRIGGFNIQNLGEFKLTNDDLMSIVISIITRYDILLVQEIVTQKGELLRKLLDQVNRFAREGVTYDLILSERLGRRTAKEQYGYFFRKDKVIALENRVFPDPQDYFMRPPYLAHFSTPTVDGLPSIVLIGIHTQPSNAANETSYLSEVYQYARKIYKTNNSIILGDMNAGCATVRKSDWDKIDLWTDPTFEWLIGHHVDTTTSLKSCPYDRIVITGNGVKSAVIPKSAGIFNFQEEYQLTDEMTKSVSDHWPVEVRLKGKLSEEVKKSLTSYVCFEIWDKRKVENPMAIHRARKKFDFRTMVSVDENGNNLEMTATRTSTSHSALTSALKNLATKFPKVIFQETAEAVDYKATHGALEDDSSNFKVQDPFYQMEVRCDLILLTCYVTMCRNISIN